MEFQSTVMLTDTPFWRASPLPQRILNGYPSGS
jgi:hypothetical protein